jgi:RNA polymerase sigma-70 factor (ECF subfamily)
MLVASQAHGLDRGNAALTGERHSEQISQAYREHRPYLVDLAFRMLGEIGAAEDVVQDAFSRLLAADLGDIDDERGWLIVVTSRLCLDQIRSARARRERAHDAGSIEFAAPRPAAPAPRQDLADPADRVSYDDQVRIALLTVLEQLTPAERVVFVLHDIFQLPFDTIGQTVGRSSAACRQLARRARQRIAGARGAIGTTVPEAEHRLITEKFIAACAGGDLHTLLEVLAPDAWGALQPGPDSDRQPVIVQGQQSVARSLIRFWGPGATLVSLPAAGKPALLGFVSRDLTALLVLSVSAGKVQSVQVIADPLVLGYVTAQLPALP